MKKIKKTTVETQNGQIPILDQSDQAFSNDDEMFLVLTKNLSSQNKNEHSCFKRVTFKEIVTKQEINNQKECWICLESENEKQMATPCECKGATKYVHKECFKSFLASKTNVETLHCSFCKRRYYLQFPRIAFLRIYELMGKFNRFVCNATFLLFLFSLLYIVIFLYGLSVIIPFAGKNAIRDYVLIYPKYKFCFSNLNLINVARIIIGAPLLPIIILTCTHQNFRIFLHIVPCILIMEKLNLKNIILAGSPMLFFIYCRLIMILESKLGKAEDVEEPGIVFNDSYVYITKMVVSLMTPYFGILFGRYVLQNIWRCIYALFTWQIVEVKYNLKTIVWSFIGCVLYVLISDGLGLLYLIMKKRKISNVKIFSRKY
ncbi:hypothetical protein EDEG_03828 [Edhazardia aedis USNM 41457]|uniref:RING-CH-type domain-containing protein n=1 Tax=Edhazardia aedis (strain USNM 41457) TaxID=1003232 RepID=J9DGA6_EDHAE|nr:hypothetical protein EDEG_03828 [Edhazardia aedis USNM 41457]|eukprot:EJW01625.1 hypothetical protein EDEG_03828 [Edhazardia aedis USNM 41457]